MDAPTVEYEKSYRSRTFLRKMVKGWDVSRRLQESDLPRSGLKTELIKIEKAARGFEIKVMNIVRSEDKKATTSQDLPQTCFSQNPSYISEKQVIV